MSVKFKYVSAGAIALAGIAAVAMHQRPQPYRFHYENVLGSGNVGSLDTLWTFATGAVVTSAPAVANGTVYFGSRDNNVYALNATTGVKLWSFTTGGLINFSTFLVSAGFSLVLKLEEKPT